MTPRREEGKWIVWVYDCLLGAEGGHTNKHTSFYWISFWEQPKFPLCIFYTQGFSYHFNAAARPAGQHCFFHFHLFGLTENSRNLAVNPWGDFAILFNRVSVLPPKGLYNHTSGLSTEIFLIMLFFNQNSVFVSLKNITF